ncbi:MAG: NAD(P)/FAD-dependent oxidoreductase [Micropepsaceae bacterium]
MRGGLDIAIAGAGVAGLAAAIMLTRAGHRVTVYERFAQSRPIGSGLMIQPVGLAALERLGLRGEIEARGARIAGIEGYTARGTTVFDIGYGELDAGLYAVAVHRAALQGVLWRAFEASGAAFVAARPAVTIGTMPDGRAQFAFEDGERSPPADLVIDASGARSALRGAVTERAPRAFTYGAVWATVPDPGVAPEKLAQRYIGAHVMLGVLPLGAIDPGGPAVAALFWSLKTAAHEAWRGRFEGWRGEAAALWPALRPCLESLNGPDDFALAHYHHITIPTPWRGPVVLIGDSAHCTSPQLGQGANHGLLDAVVLADAIAAAGNVPGALALYANARRRQVWFYQRASAVMTPLFQSDSRVFPALRDLTFHRMKIVPYLKREMVRTLAGLKTGLFTSASPERIARL